MAGTTISNSTTIGISLTNASQNPVTVTSSGTIHTVGGNAIYAPFGLPGTIANDGVLASDTSDAIRLMAGGTVTNGSASDKTASIAGGAAGIRFGIHGAGTVNNFGTIANTGTSATGVGVAANGSATVVNGSTADTSALITGYFEGVRISGPAASVTNFGTISATGTSTTVGSASLGIYFRTGGSVTNGSDKDTTASIIGGTWAINIQQAAGTIANFGTIKGVGPLARGIVMGAGGSVVNGSATDTAAYIAAASRNGVYIGGVTSSTVVNFGTIKSLDTVSSGGNDGVALRTGGTVTNGSATDTNALISGGSHGVYIEGALPSAVINFGTIAGAVGQSINLYLGGSVTNGSAADTKALIIGPTGIYIGGPATVTNFGTILSTGPHAAIVMEAGGSVINGSASDTTALIAVLSNVGTHSAIYNRTGQTTITNFGTIKSPTSSGIALEAGGTIVNGSTADTTALIVGLTGIYIGGPATVTNFGTILSTGPHTAIVMEAGGSVVNGSESDTTALIVVANVGTKSAIYNLAAQATITNFGTIKSPTASGVHLQAGGTIINGSTADTAALIVGSTSGSSIVIQAGPVSISNFATIGAAATGTSGIFLGQGGSVTNGSAADTKAAIIGGGGTVGSGIFVSTGTAIVSNFGTISGGGSGINLGSSGTLFGTGTVTNGSATVTTAAISGGSNGIFAAGKITVNNFAAVTGTSAGVALTQGGSLTNGSQADTKATIAAGSTIGSGIFVLTGTAWIGNFGTISGGGNGINFGSNGTVASTGTIVNGTTAVTNALILGSTNGIFASGVAMVANFGTVKATAQTGIALGKGGSITNGSEADKIASIVGANGTNASGVFVGGGTAPIVNFGTISGGGTGVNFGGSGTISATGAITNGSAADTTALIVGTSNGIFATGKITVSNFASIKAANFDGIFLGQGGIVSNGTATDTTALITTTGTNGIGVFVNTGQATITNFGTVSGGNIGIQFSTGGSILSGGTVINSGVIASGKGAAGTAIQFGAGPERLVLRPGSSITGKVIGGAGLNTLELAAGTGTTGSIGTNFVNFGTVVADAGANWTLTGINTAGTVTNNGTISVAAAGKLQVTAAVDPASNGLFQLNNAAILEVLADKGTSNQISFLGTGEVIIDHAANFGINVGQTTYQGPLIEHFGVNDSIDIKDIASAGAILNYASATGLLQVTSNGIAAATLDFQNSNLGAGTFHPNNDGTGHLLITHG